MIYRVDGYSVKGFGYTDPLDPWPVIASVGQTNRSPEYYTIQLQRTEMNFEKVLGRTVLRDPNY